MTGYTSAPESSISGNWMDFILIYTLSFSLTHRLNPCMGFHPLPSPPITHFTPIIIIPTWHSRQVQRKCSMLTFMNWLYVFKAIINLSASECVYYFYEKVFFTTHVHVSSHTAHQEIVNWTLFIRDYLGNPLMGVKLVSEEVSSLQGDVWKATVMSSKQL